MTDFALSPRFGLVRSYIKGIGFYAPPASTIIPASDGATVYWPASYGIAVRAVVKPQFWAWNSNCYTPDWIYAEYYAFFVSAPATHFTYLPFTTFVHLAPPYSSWYLTNHLDIWSDFYTADLPAAPPGYWLPVI